MVVQLEMKKGGKIGWHYHPDCIEILNITKGTMVDLHTELIYTENDAVKYIPMEEHTIYALEDLSITVLITKTLNT